MRFAIHAPGDPLDRAEQVGQHFHLRARAVRLQRIDGMRHRGVPLRVAFLGRHHVGLGIEHVTDNLQRMRGSDGRPGRRSIGHDGVQAHAGPERQVAEIHRFVAGDRDDIMKRIGDRATAGNHQRFVDVVFVARAQSYAHALARDIRNRSDPLLVLVDDQHRRRVVVAHREVENLGALVRGAHGADADVPAALPATGDDGLPAGSRQTELHAQPRGNRACHIDIESRQLVVLIDEAERRVVSEQHIHHHAALLHPLQRGASTRRCAAQAHEHQAGEPEHAKARRPTTRHHC